jgi:hypothetical protein
MWHYLLIAANRIALMTFKKRKALFILLLIFIAATAFILLKFYVFSYLGSALNEKIQSLKISGFNVKYDSISLDWRRNVVIIDQLVLQKNAYDTTCIYPEFMAVRKIRAEGFRLMPLLLQNKLSFETVHLEEPHLVIREKSLMTIDSATQRKNEFTLAIDKVFLTSAHIEYTDSVNCELITSFRSHLSMAALRIDFYSNKRFLLAAERVTVDSARLRLPKDFYTLHIRKTKIDFLKQTLKLDTLKVIPDLGKLEFGRKHGYEVDRFEGLIPFVSLSGFSVSFRDSTVIRSNLADVQFYLKIFRDKRLPFKKKSKVLPIALLQDLPFTLLIDSLKITKSYIQYEEFVKEASDPGGIFFDNLSAVFNHINNKSRAGITEVTAQASLMGQGYIRLFATFPWSKNKKARVMGSLKNFSMPKINSMLTPATYLKVESGEMKNFSFNFSFNSIRSDGEIELNYTDLKVVTFKEEDKKNGKAKKSDEDKLQKDNLKTFMMNTFIFRKNMDEKVSEEKRTGTVMFIRDDSRSIFNFWVKSVLSGIKSAYNLDKPAAKKNKREIKKEEKITKREARKLKRAAKRKEPAYP